MDGITILNTIIVNDCADWVSFTALTLGVICIVAFILTLTSNDNRVIIFGIISLLAICKNNSKLAIVTELAQNGSLYDYLHKENLTKEISIEFKMKILKQLTTKAY